MSLEQHALPSATSSPPEAFSNPPTPPDMMEEQIIATAASSIFSIAPTSASAPEIHSTTQVSFVSSILTSPSVDTALAQSSSPAENVSFEVPLSSSQSPDTDPQILEALRSKDRIYVLQLGEKMESLINERRTRIDLNPITSYQRMLVHRCSAYYKLAPQTDATTKTIFVYYRSESRIPARRISELAPVEETTSQPAFKIMRRNAPDRERGRARYNSQPGSVAGEDADLSDVEQSETSSIGGRSNATGTSSKRHLTIEERTAAYNQARSRIFMDFEEKEVEKEKDSSANSSTHSLVSGSGSTSGERSSAGDADDSASSAATESEWSGPAARDKRDGWRGGSTTSSSRSTRLSDTSFTKNDSGSSRNSRATSPSFTYPSLYEAPNPPSSYDTAYGPQGPPGGYYPYFYPYPPPPGHMPGQPYMTPYPYYPPYGYPSPPHQASPHHHSDPTTPAVADVAYPQGQPPPPMAYPNSYMWHHPPAGHQPPPQMPPPTQGTHPAPPTPIQQPSSQGQPQPQQVPYPYMQPGPYATYPMHGYYPPPPFQPSQPMQSSHTPPHVQGHQYGPPDMMHPMDATQLGVPNGIHSPESNGNSRASSRNSNSHIMTNGSGRRGAPRTRHAYSYGPGAGGVGFQYGGQGVDVVGPRLTTRRTSGTSSGSGSAGNRTPGDEASSTTSSSTTSSSSRRTFTSTSSKHPLPARPDWAVGLKAHTGLHPPRSHDHSNPHSRTMSPARFGVQAHPNNQHGSQQSQQPSLQSTDFPPLSSAPVSEKRHPVVASAWTNTLANRSIMTAGPQTGATAPAAGTALIHYPNPTNGEVQGATPRTDDPDRSYERPPPKGNMELFNPKGAARKNTANRTSMGPIDKENNRVGVEAENPRTIEATAIPTLAEKMGGISMEDRPSCVDGVPAAVAPTNGAGSVESLNGSS